MGGIPSGSLWIFSTNGNIQYNELTGNTVNGLVLDNSSANTVGNNSVNGNGVSDDGSGILVVLSSGNRVTGNRTDENGQAGI